MEKKTISEKVSGKERLKSNLGYRRFHYKNDVFVGFRLMEKSVWKIKEEEYINMGKRRRRLKQGEKKDKNRIEESINERFEKAVI